MGTGTLTLAFLLLAAGSPPPEMWSLNDRAFNFPIQIEPARKAEIRELRLSVSSDLGKTWQEGVRVASPHDANFPYEVSADGIYWFSISVVDQQGRVDPPSPYHSADKVQKVIVDTVAPQLRLAAERQGDVVEVRWEISDQYPDLASLRLQYRAADAMPSSWVPVSINNPAAVGQTYFRPGSTGPILVRMDVQDLAQNLANAQVDVSGLAAGASSATTGYVPVGATMNPRPSGSPIPSPNNQSQVVLRGPPPREGSGGGWGTIYPTSTGGTGGVQVLATSQRGTPAGRGYEPATPAPRLPVEGGPPVEIINTNQITLNYKVSKFGPSGVSVAEVYVTRDERRPWTWRRVGEEPIEPPQPSELQGPEKEIKRSLFVGLEDDGVYGFYLVVRNGANKGKPPPRSEDAPMHRVEVDRKGPEATLYQPVPDARQRDALVLQWSANDRNLGPTVKLEWTADPNGQWQLIGEPDSRLGQFVWQLPPNSMPPQVYLRLIVRDTAGNEGVAQTATPILIDLTEPEVQIINVGANR